MPHGKRHPTVRRVPQSPALPYPCGPSPLPRLCTKSGPSCPQAGKGSATLSMAYAAAAFADSCLRAMAGEGGVVECAYVESHLVPGLPFFASQLRLGPHGVTEILPLGQLDALEEEGLQVCPHNGLFPSKFKFKNLYTFRHARLKFGSAFHATCRL